MEVVSFATPAALPSGKKFLVPIVQEAAWTPEPVWKRWQRDKFLPPVGTWTPDHPASSPALYHWAIPAPNAYIYTRVKPKVSGLAVWSENCKWYRRLGGSQSRSGRSGEEKICSCYLQMVEHKPDLSLLCKKEMNGSETGWKCCLWNRSPRPIQPSRSC
jgi:hypothetical protein